MQFAWALRLLLARRRTVVLSLTILAGNGGGNLAQEGGEGHGGSGRACVVSFLTPSPVFCVSASGRSLFISLSDGRHRASRLAALLPCDLPACPCGGDNAPPRRIIPSLLG